MAEYFDRLMQMMAERERANQNAASEAALRRSVAPGAAETIIDFANKALRRYDEVFERKRLKKETAVKDAEEKARLAKEKEEKRSQWLLGERLQTQRAYGLPSPEVGIEGTKQYAPRSPRAIPTWVDPQTGVLYNKGTGAEIGQMGTGKQATSEQKKKEAAAGYGKAIDNFNKVYKKTSFGRVTYSDPKTKKPVFPPEEKAWIRANYSQEDIEKWNLLGTKGKKYFNLEDQINPSGAFKTST